MSPEEYRKTKEENRCVDCGKQDRRTLEGRCFCERCQKFHSVKDRNRRSRLKEQHCCIFCGKQDGSTLAGKPLCDECRLKHNARRRLSRERAKKEGTL